MGFWGAINGFGAAVGLSVGLWIVLFLIDMSIIQTYFFLPALGLIQWAYLIPMGRRYKARGDSTRAAGLYIGGGIIFLLNSACFGMIFMY